ncbi:MAG: B-box zinc finger protein [Terriglobales bacterium]
MNCAYHADQSAVAYCRTCGKALCANCTRPVRGVIYCEDCLGAKMQGTAPAAAVPPPAGTPYQQFMDQGLGMKVAPGPASGPNPTVAGILAGFFPFGVGPVYTGQYAKGLVHLAIFALLVAGINVGSEHDSGALCAFSVIGLIFFIVYQIIDSVRSAKAIQAGLPAPDPYGLAATFGAGTKLESNKAPIGAIVLILLGVLFLLSTMGVELGLDRFWPLILIGVGGWLFARNWGLTGSCAGRCQCARCRSCKLMGPAVLVTLGFLFLFETLGRVGFHRTWPILLLVIGGVKLFQSSASTEGHIVLPPPDLSIPPAGIPPASVPPPPDPPAPPSAPSEVSHG